MRKNATRFILVSLLVFVLAFVHGLAVKFQILLGPLPRIAPEWWLPG